MRGVAPSRSVGLLQQALGEVPDSTNTIPMLALTWTGAVDRVKGSAIVVPMR